MDVNDRIRFTDAMTALCMAFRIDADPLRVKVFWMALSDLSIDDVEQACASLLQSSKFMPVPAEIRALCGARLPSEDDRAETAWAALSQAVVRQGAYRSVDFEDRTINAVVRSLGGWPELCATPAGEFDTFVRARFLKAYKSLWACGVGDEQSAPLIGISDATNQSNAALTEVTTGLPTPARKAIGVPRLGEIVRNTTERLKASN